MATDDGTPALRPRGRAREAQANDQSVLEAARDVFAELGYSAPMAAVAERAGVGVASIYRRYPSKDSLVHDLRLLALQQVTELAVDAARSEPGTAVRAFLENHLRRTAGPLISTFGRDAGLSPEVDAASERLRVALDALVARDAGTGVIPSDYSAADLMIGLTHLRTALPADRARQVELHLRQLDIYLAGLRASAADPAAVRGASMSWAEWVTLNTVSPRRP